MSFPDRSAIWTWVRFSTVTEQWLFEIKKRMDENETSDLLEDTPGDTTEWLPILSVQRNLYAIITPLVAGSVVGGPQHWPSRSPDLSPLP
jgi:hypothetical protein